MSPIPADERPSSKTFVSSNAGVQLFRSRIREMIFRRYETKKHIKQAAKDYEHYDHFFAIIEKLNIVKGSFLTLAGS